MDELVALRARVDEQERALELLRENNRELLSLINGSPAAICILDPAGMVKMWNPAAEQMFGWSVEEALGQFNPIIQKDQREAWSERHRRAAGGDRAVGLEVVRQRKDGTEIDISVSTARIRDAQGQVEWVIGIVLDITERKRIEREILELNATLEERVTQRTSELAEALHDLESFSYSVSHDLRSPLRSIDGFANAVLEDYGDLLDDEGRRLLGIVVRNAQRMGHLIDDLLEFSRMGRKPIQSSPTDMQAMALTIVAELRESDPERAVEVVLGSLPMAQVDPSMVRQVLVNLLSNGWKFSRKNPQAWLEVGYANGAYFVRDNGAGFDMQYIDKLFGVFQRLHRQDEFEGTGVGLAICQKIINRHGGRIWAESELGRGATFYLTLPHCGKSP